MKGSFYVIWYDKDKMIKTIFLSAAKEKFLLAVYFESLDFPDVYGPWGKLSCVVGTTLTTWHYPHDLRSTRNQCKCRAHTGDFIYSSNIHGTTVD